MKCKICNTLFSKIEAYSILLYCRKPVCNKCFGSIQVDETQQKIDALLDHGYSVSEILTMNIDETLTKLEAI